jgi:hypothetical protein
MESALIAAPAKPVYDIIADYRNGHPHILPQRYFQFLKVEVGGYGAGTIISFGMRVAGQSRVARAEVTEPEPGRLLAETIPEDGIITTFDVVPVNQEHTQVTITTKGPTRRTGLLGGIERRMSEMFLKRVYKKELQLLNAVARERAHLK